MMSTTPQQLYEQHERNAPEFVLQPWVATVGLKMQSILLSGLRAPDHHTKAIKKCVRWLRSRCQIDADPSKQSYMQTVPMSKALIDEAIDELEYCTVHYAHHFADAFAVMAYFHPDNEVRRLAYYAHFRVAEELMHFMPESREQFINRHRDKRASTDTELPQIEESIALDDSCQRMLFSRGHLDEASFRAACADHIRAHHAVCCLPRIPQMRVLHKYLRHVPLRGNMVSDSKHIILDEPGAGATPVTMLSDWLPLHPCGVST